MMDPNSYDDSTDVWALQNPLTVDEVRACIVNPISVEHTLPKLGELENAGIIAGVMRRPRNSDSEVESYAIILPPECWRPFVSLVPHLFGQRCGSSELIKKHLSEHRMGRDSLIILEASIELINAGGNVVGSRNDAKNRALMALMTRWVYPFLASFHQARALQPFFVAEGVSVTQEGFFDAVMEVICSSSTDELGLNREKFRTRFEQQPSDLSRAGEGRCLLHEFDEAAEVAVEEEATIGKDGDTKDCHVDNPLPSGTTLPPSPGSPTLPPAQSEFPGQHDAELIARLEEQRVVDLQKQQDLALQVKGFVTQLGSKINENETLKGRVKDLEHMLKDASNDSDVLKRNVVTHEDKNRRDRETQALLLETQDALIADLEAKVEELEVEKAMAKGGQQQGVRKQQRKEARVPRKEVQPPRREAQLPRKEGQLQGSMKQKMPAVALQSFEAPLPPPRARQTRLGL